MKTPAPAIPAPTAETLLAVTPTEDAGAKAGASGPPPVLSVEQVPPPATRSEAESLFDSFFSDTPGAKPAPVADTPAPVEPQVALTEEKPAPKIIRKKSARPKWEKVHVFKSERLPAVIYRKDYAPENRHLPTRFTESEYNRLLFAAAARNDVNALRAMLDDGRDKNARNSRGDTPLIAASRAGATDTVRLLLLRGADADAADGRGYTALHYAAYNGNVEIVRALREKGADPDAAGSEGVTPRMAARGQERVLRGL